MNENELSPAEQAGKTILAYRKTANEVPHPDGLAGALRYISSLLHPSESCPERDSSMTDRQFQDVWSRWHQRLLDSQYITSIIKELEDFND